MNDLCPTAIYGFSTDVSLCVSTCVWANVRRGSLGMSLKHSNVHVLGDVFQGRCRACSSEHERLSVCVCVCLCVCVCECLCVSVCVYGGTTLGQNPHQSQMLSSCRSEVRFVLFVSSFGSFRPESCMR